ERSRRRFQLADRLARLYSQYLVYRADWLTAWANGKLSYASAAHPDAQVQATECRLLAPLWQQAVREIGAHRAEVIEQLLANIERDAADAEAAPTLHVFGISHLAPAELAMLKAWSRHALVALYLPDPCSHYWGVLETGSAQAWQAEEHALIAAADGGDWWRPQKHELLARWGRLGQHFFSALLELAPNEDIRHWQDGDAAAPVNRLQRVQESIRRLDEGLIVPTADIATEIADGSLRVHVAHTTQRELEILRDAMLAARAAGIEPGDMLVMAPDIRRYLPLIPAVFGRPGDAREPIPYHSADVPVAQSHPLFAAFLRVLAMTASRIGVAEVLDFIATPAVKRRFDLGDDGLAALAELLRESRVAWSLDPAHRASFGVPGLAEHGFAWALDRMITGYLVDDSGAGDSASLHLPDDTELLPLAAIQGEHAAAVGALDAVLLQLQQVLTWSDQTRPASEWVPRLIALLDALFSIDPTDRVARKALDDLKRTINALREEVTVAEVDPALHFSVVIEQLESALQGVPEHQSFLLGGATFSGMVPRRALPFRFIAVLGLDDGEFPRHVDDGGLDLMARLRRLGDRDQRFDDRYLFLETLMSARDHLHLSYIGEGVRDGKPRNPAAPLAELCAVLGRADQAAGEAMAKALPWQVRHPLQPFDLRYFAGTDPRLFTYHAASAAMHEAAASPADTQISTMRLELPATIGLHELKAYWRDPAQALLERRMYLSLEGLDDERLSSEEPSEAKLSGLDSVVRRLVFDEALAVPGWNPDQAPDWLRLDGRMPVGSVGELAWQHEREQASIIANVLRARGAVVDDAPPVKQGLSADLQLPVAGQTVRITGRIDGLYAHPDGGLQLIAVVPPKKSKTGTWSDGALHFARRLPIWLDWMLARLSLPRDIRLRLSLATLKPSSWSAHLDACDHAYHTGEIGRATLEAALAQSIIWWQEAGHYPLRYFPRTSAAAIEAMSAEKNIAHAVHKAWQSDRFGTGERDYRPGYTALLAGDEMFAEGSARLAELCDFAVELNQLLALSTEDAA
ncbi:MAG: exodeoxyribonuclease V subunit gamma, partial [Pseudomonadota bacterium]|nr:exodeoxyribonuclease V subunit gamma [Pseudomonadota bacterium]